MMDAQVDCRCSIIESEQVFSILLEGRPLLTFQSLLVTTDIRRDR